MRNSSGGVVNVTNSYYTRPLGTAQGKQARSIIAGQHVTMQNAGTATEYAISGITAYGVGIKYNDVLYAGVGDAVSLNLGITWDDGFEGGGFRVSDGTLSGSDNLYTLTMDDADVLISANIEVTPWEGDGTEASPYLIRYICQWELLADKVAVGTDYSGKHFQLASDITVTRMVGNMPSMASSTAMDTRSPSTIARQPTMLHPSASSMAPPSATSPSPAPSLPRRSSLQASLVRQPA